MDVDRELRTTVLERLPMPAQFDRIIMVGGTIAVLAAAPILVVLLALLVADQITAPEFVFWMIATVIVGGALGTVLLSHLVHAALALVATMLGVAGMYLLLGSEFLALAQVLLYGGGVVILLLFGLMMTNAQNDPIVTDGAQKPFALIAAGILGALIVTAIVDANWVDNGITVVDFRDFGTRLFNDFGLPFIVIAVLLDVALSGAYIIARRQSAADEEAGA